MENWEEKSPLHTLFAFRITICWLNNLQSWFNGVLLNASYSHFKGRLHSTIIDKICQFYFRQVPWSHIIFACLHRNYCMQCNAMYEIVNHVCIGSMIELLFNVQRNKIGKSHPVAIVHNCHTVRHTTKVNTMVLIFNSNVCKTAPNVCIYSRQNQIFEFGIYLNLFFLFGYFHWISVTVAVIYRKKLEKESKNELHTMCARERVCVCGAVFGFRITRCMLATFHMRFSSVASIHVIVTHRIRFSIRIRWIWEWV